MKCLIIDDEPLVRRSLTRVLKNAGHEIAEACDGLEGVEMWKNSQPDVVFLDVLMPGLSGPEVLQEMGGEFKSRVILMSAYVGEHNMETARQLGADIFVAKPFENIFDVVSAAEALVEGENS